MSHIFMTDTDERLWSDADLPLPNYVGRQLQIDIRFEDQVLTRLYQIDAIDATNAVAYVTLQKSYLNDQLIERSVPSE